MGRLFTSKRMPAVHQWCAAHCPPDEAAHPMLIPQGAAVRTYCRNTFYGAVVGGAICVFGMPPPPPSGRARCRACSRPAHYLCICAGAAGYVLFGELVAPTGAYPLIERTVRRLEGEAAVRQRLGTEPLALYGASQPASRATRRRPSVATHTTDDGRHVMEATFYVEGGGAAQRAARVTLQAEREGAEGEWRDAYLALDFADAPHRLVVVEAAKGRRSARAPRTLHAVQNGWHPLSSLAPSKD